MMFLPEMNRGVSVKKKKEREKKQKWFKGENVCGDGREGVRGKTKETGGRKRKRGRVSEGVGHSVW